MATELKVECAELMLSLSCHNGYETHQKNLPDTPPRLISEDCSFVRFLFALLYVYACLCISNMSGISVHAITCFQPHTQPWHLVAMATGEGFLWCVSTKRLTHTSPRTLTALFSSFNRHMGDIWRSDLRRGKSRFTFRLDLRLHRHRGRAALTVQLEAPCGSHLACWEAKWHQGIMPIQDDICSPKSQLSVRSLIALLRPVCCHKPPPWSGLGGGLIFRLWGVGGGRGGWASPFCLTLAKTQTRNELKNPFIIMDLAFSTQAP